MQNIILNYDELPKRIINNKECISWKNTENITINFSYNEEYHSMKILKYIDNKHISVEFDDGTLQTFPPRKILNLSFSNVYKKKKFRYSVGQIVNGYKIISCFFKGKTNSKYERQAYVCKCLIDGYEFEKFEYEINMGSKCPVCTHQKVLTGFNDIATTSPWVMKYLYDKNDGYNYSNKSNKYIKVKCPFCGNERTMRIAELCTKGFSCSICSDGISYPNKFAHELFFQLKEQYEYYEFEYSPEWANGYRYDNYILLKNGKKIIVEMDGGYHYKNNFENNDLIKDTLSKEHDIDIIRINCNYPKSENRYEFIKENVVLKLHSLFDLSNINWDKCNSKALSNKMHSAILSYNTDKDFDIEQCAKSLNLATTTIKTYLKTGNDMGLCDYQTLFDTERIGNTKPICTIDSNGNIVSLNKSVKELCEDNSLNEKVVRDVCCGFKKRYKGYTFRYVTKDEYYKLKKNFSRELER